MLAGEGRVREKSLTSFSRRSDAFSDASGLSWSGGGGGEGGGAVDASLDESLDESCSRCPFLIPNPYLTSRWMRAAAGALS